MIDDVIYVDMPNSKQTRKTVKAMNCDYEIRAPNFFDEYVCFYLTEKQYTMFSLKGIEHRCFNPRHQEHIGNEHLILDGLF